MHPSLHQFVTKNEMAKIFLLFLQFEKRRGHDVSSFLELWQQQKDTFFCFGFWLQIDETINKTVERFVWNALFIRRTAAKVVWQVKSNLVFFASAKLKNIPN